MDRAIMSKSAGPQHPQAPPLDAGAVLAWYDAHARDLPWRVPPAARAAGTRPDPYAVWLSEVMLQQTTVAAVRRYYLRFRALWPTVADLAAAPLDAVLVEWAGLGYYARARNLHASAMAVAALPGGRFPPSAAGLLALPGVGAYTAAAVAAIAYDERVAVLDGNVERVLARYLALREPVRERKEALRAFLQRAVPARAGDFAQALMDLGATVCAPRAALCMLCPLRPGCAGAKGDPLAFPVKPAKPERPTRHGHAYVIRDRAGDVYLRARPDRGLLAKMTEVPGSDWTPARGAPDFPFAANWQPHGVVVHVFTHFRLELAVWSAETPQPSALGEGWWADPRELGAEALPSLFRKVLAAAGLE
jgi:A/G-specific adenine glycosylase